MYKGHSIWDEEERQGGKYDNIANRGGDRLEYRNQKDYAAGDANPSDVYNTTKAEEENKKEETGIEKEVSKEKKKYERKEEANEENIKRKAASEVHEEGKKEGGVEKKKKEHKSIEDAINKAMKEEKEVIYVDD